MKTRDSLVFCVALLLFLLVFLGAMRLARDSTVYAPGYSEAKFRSIRNGMLKAEVIRILGNPLSIEPAPAYILWTYAAKDFRNPAPPQNGPTTTPTITFVKADVTGKIVSADGAYLNIKAADFLNRPIEEVRKRFGDPLESYSAPERELYWYSKMDGVKGHFVRFIDISTEGIVSQISAGRIGYYTGGEGNRNLGWIEWLEETF